MLVPPLKVFGTRTGFSLLFFFHHSFFLRKQKIMNRTATGRVHVGVCFHHTMITFCTQRVGIHWFVVDKYSYSKEFKFAVQHVFPVEGRKNKNSSTRAHDHARYEMTTTRFALWQRSEYYCVFFSRQFYRFVLWSFSCCNQIFSFIRDSSVFLVFYSSSLFDVREQDRAMKNVHR